MFPFLSPLYYIVVSTKQFGAINKDVSSLDNEVFPMEKDLVNFTQQASPAQIRIPPQVLLEEMSRSSFNGNELRVIWNTDSCLLLVRTRLPHVLFAESLPLAHILFKNLEGFLPVDGLK